MARYIDADEFAKKLKGWLKEDKLKDFIKDENVESYAIYTCLCGLEAQPTADVAPRAEVEKIFEEIAFVMKEYADRDIDEPELYARIGTIHRRFTKGENAQKDYFTPEEVRKMSRTEVRKNYQAITDSMKKW